MITLARTRTNIAHSIMLYGAGNLPANMPRDVRLSLRSHLYFAYGADLSEPLLRRRCPDVRSLGRAALSGFALRFAGDSKTWGGSTLTLVPDQGARVDGVLYLVSQLSLADLDRIQGAPVVYERVTVRLDVGTERASAHAYCMRPPLRLGQPSDAYFRLVLAEYDRLGIDTLPLFRALEHVGDSRGLARRPT